jgi:hypothetical protein
MTNLTSLVYSIAKPEFIVNIVSLGYGLQHFTNNHLYVPWLGVGGVQALLSPCVRVPQAYLVHHRTVAKRQGRAFSFTLKGKNIDDCFDDVLFDLSSILVDACTPHFDIDEFLFCLLWAKSA